MVARALDAVRLYGLEEESRDETSVSEVVG